MQVLDIPSFPLMGARLIEASAGTGKTYTIASLYLRLLLEQGLGVQNILVVTFTNAATEELRDRVRKRLRDALSVLQRDNAADEVLARILANLTDTGQAIQRLKDALVCMDEAAIFTIHGFCQRMLSEHAFESGALFEADFISDESEYLRAIAEDFWRAQFYGLSAAEAHWVQKKWLSPHDLLGAVRRYLNRHELRVVPEVGAGQSAQLRLEHAALRAQVQAMWRRDQAQIMEILRTYPGFHGNKFRKATVEKAILALEDYLTRPAGYDLPKDFVMFTAGKHAQAMKGGFEPPQHPFFALCEQFQATAAIMEIQWEGAILGHFIQFAREQLVRRKAEANVIATDDLLLKLRDALASDSGAALAARIRGRYRAAMIDEFQDTDPVQYEIFRRIYHGQEACGFYLIGDPKQAIYSFRGADIFTYIDAKHDFGEHERYTLQTNRRSVARLVQAVNGLFSSAKAPFVYEADIAFHPVHAAADADRQPLLIDAQPAVPLQVWMLSRQGEEKISKSQAKELLAQRCAQEIAGLLTLGQAQRARLGERPLAAQDIAVLVRSRRDAETLQRSLRTHGVASAFISRESVFHTNEARALGLLLSALLDPADERVLRAALCDDLLCSDAAQVFHWQQHEVAWEEKLEQFREYHELWRDGGFMKMFQRLLHEQGLPGKMLQREGGERALSNLLQLAELLQNASKQLHSMEALAHWYVEQIEETAEDEERQLRLESDESLVQIVTIHKSKGLEYPIVFLPFVFDSVPVSPKDYLLFHEAERGQLTLDLGSAAKDSHHVLAERERLAEELRLLYVALTRAKHLCYLAWGPVAGAEHSALAYLLHGEEANLQECTDAALAEPWKNLARAQPESIAVRDLPPAREVVYRSGMTTSLRARALKFSATIDRRWQMASFTALTRQRAAAMRAQDYDADLAPGAPAESPGGEKNIFTFPRGARAGQLIHAVFETIDFTRKDRAALARAVEAQLRRFGFDLQWQQTLEQLVDTVLAANLDAAEELRLNTIGNDAKLVELEFHYPLAPLTSERLHGVLADFAGYTVDEHGLSFAPLRGMMTGFIDLVFEHQGRFYLLDYKSNHLGTSSADYRAERLAAAMREHRYDLQYLIYAVALHRYLRTRVPDYDYHNHFGGVFYLFVRGMAPGDQTRPGVYHARPSAELIHRLDRLFVGGEV
ncbi:MAG: exodeoxyribonuclease V subunit beta [Pseudomonadota bacterium]